MRPLIWLRRIRHRRGYGIHSPSAFAFVTGVIYERGEYYAYKPLRRKYRLRGCRLKHARLMFRLANHVQPHTIIVPKGTPESIQAYLQAGCMDARIVEVALSAEAILMCNGSRSLIIVPEPFRQKGLFESLRNNPKAIVSYDLYDFGLFFFDSTKQKQHFIINYESLY